VSLGSRTMTTPRLVRVRRTAGLMTACGALLASGLSAAPDARAVASEAEWEIELDAYSFNPTTWDNCTVVGEETDESGPLAPGELVSRSTGGTFEITNPGDPTDTQSFSGGASSRWKVRDAGGSFRDYEFSSQGTLEGEAALGEATECQSSVDVSSYGEGVGDAPAAGFLELSLETTQDMSAAMAFDQPSTGGASVSSGPGGIFKRLGGTGSARAFVEAGEFYFFSYTELRAEIYEEDGEIMTRRAEGSASVGGTATGLLTFIAAGSPVSAASGAAKKYVSLNARTCGNDKVVTKLKKKAKKAAKVTYTVNGDRAEVVKKPKKGTVKLGGLDPAAEVTVKAAVKLKKGGTKTVTRSYVACTG